MKQTPIDVTLQPFPPVPQSLGGNVVTIKSELSAGWGYRAMHMLLSAGLTLNMLNEIRLITNLGQIFRCKGTDLDTMNKFYKAPGFADFTEQILSIYFRRLGIRGGAQGFTPPATLLSGSASDLALETILNCGSYNANKIGISTLTLEIDVTGTPGTAETITVLGEGVDPYPGGPGLVPILDKNTFNAVAGGNTLTKTNAFNYGDLKHSMLDGLHLIPAGGTLDNFLMNFNNNKILSRTNAENRYIQSIDALRVPQAGMFSFDWTADGFGDEALLIGPSITQLELQLVASAGAITVYQKSMGYIG